MAEGNYYNWHERFGNRVPENMRIGDDLMIISENDMTGSIAAPRKVDVTTFIITNAGNATVAIEGKEHKLQAPSLAIVMPGQTYHLIESSEDLAFRAVILSRRFTEGLLGLYNGSSRLQDLILEYPVLDISHDMASFNTYYKMLLNAINSPVRIFRLESAMHLTLSMLYYYARRLEGSVMAKDKRQMYCDKFMADVRTFYRVNRTLPFYAGKLGVSVTYMTELIKEKCGMTAAEYIDRHTVTECMALLNSTSLSMNQISRMMNFPSPSVFGKFFKRMTGVSPTEYRNGESAQ